VEGQPRPDERACLDGTGFDGPTDGLGPDAAPEDGYSNGIPRLRQQAQTTYARDTDSKELVRINHGTHAATGQSNNGSGTGATVTNATKQANVDRTTFYRWLKSDATFLAQLNRAQQEQVEAILPTRRRFLLLSR
jgi:hypothetical protein